MRKIRKAIFLITSLFVALTSTFVFAPSAKAAAFYTDIRVLISTGTVKSIDITAVGDYYLKENDSFKIGTDKMTVSMTGNRPTITSKGKTFTASSITLVSRDYKGTSSYIKFKNSKYGVCTYLGNMAFDVSKGSLRVINTLPIEHYLYGVVPYEMSNTFPTEALKSQAICARGYATANCSANRSRVYDILDTSADQVYHGYASKYTRAISAVDDTAGKVLIYDGDIIQTYYSASNGGQTELTGNVWNSNLPYYVQRDDIYDVENPYSIGEESFIPSEFNSETLPLMDKTVLNMIQSGAENAAGGKVTLISTLCITAYAPKFAPPSRCFTMADVVLMVKTADGKTGQLTVTLSLDSLLYSDKNPDGIFNIKMTLRMRGAEQGVLKADGKEYGGWFITNRRYGHGIGLSQRGAQQRATDRENYNDILNFYYADIKLCTVGTYKSAPAMKSKKYVISESFISGIVPGTSPEQFLSKISSDGGKLSLISASGKEKTDGDVSTGDFLRTVYDDGASYFDLPVVVYGDTNGDGKIDQSDIDAMRKHFLNTDELTGVYFTAADVNHDGKADSFDLLLLIKNIQGTASIEQKGGKTGE